MSEMKTTYGDVEIFYDEPADRWRFTLRGKERSAESLAKAKEAIDKPAPKDAKPFKRFEAWFKKSYSHDAVKVTVTSICERGRGAQTVRITGNKQERLSDLYADTETNRKRIAEMKELQNAMKKIEKRMSEIEKNLEPVNLAVDTDE